MPISTLSRAVACLIASTVLACGSSRSGNTGTDASHGEADGAGSATCTGCPNGVDASVADSGSDDASQEAVDGGTSEGGAGNDSGGRSDGGATGGDSGGPGDGGCKLAAGLMYDGGVPLDCAAKPSACCYPDGTNTGVPAGTTLTASGSMEVNTDGTVISGLDITGTLDIYANNVTVKNTRVTVSSSGSYAVAVRPGATGAVIEDTTISGQDNSANSVEYAIYVIGPSNPVVLQRIDLSNCSECILGGNVTLTDSYIHDTADPPGAHVEDIYGLANSIYRHNTMTNSHDQTAIVYLDPNLGGTLDCNCMVTDNLLIGGGGYTIYGGSSSTQTATNVGITNNRFSNMYYPTGGSYGLDAYFTASAAGNSWTGNYWDDTAASAGP